MTLEHVTQGEEPPLDLVLDTAIVALERRPLPAPLAMVRGIVLAKEHGVELVLATLDQLDALKVQLLAMLATHLSAVGPVFKAIDELADASTADGLPVLVLARDASGGLRMDHATLPVPDTLTARGSA